MSSTLGRPRSLALTIALVTLVVAPLALAQTATPKKKKRGTKPAASASATATATATATTAAAPEPPPEAAPAAGGSESAAGASATTGDGASPGARNKSKDTESAEAAGSEGKAAGSDVFEDPRHTYYFAGLRYRHTILPTFMLHLFISEGAAIHQNSIAAELDIRKEGKSTIPWIAYQEYGTGDMLMFQKNCSQPVGGSCDQPNNYTVVNSSLKAIYVGLDEMWSAPITPQLEFEYGFGVGLGFLFGSLQNDWVYENDKTASSPGGPLVGSNGHAYSECTSESQPGDGTGSCQRSAHSGASVAKVNGYTEPNWFGGGVIPVVFPHVSFPQIGLRYRPTKQIAARLGLGFSLTGFWLGLSADYDVEPLVNPQDKEDKGDKKDTTAPEGESEHKTSLGALRSDTL
jgi:hypothetical protein